MVNIAIVGAPVDLGAGRRGVDMGPSAIRYADLEAGLRSIGHDVLDLGNIEVPVAESMAQGPDEAKYLEPIVAMAEQLTARVARIVEDGRFPLVLGGDHSVSLGSVAGVARHRSIGLIWIDAHGDFNTPDTSPSGNIHGMVLSALAGYGIPRMVNIGGFAPKVLPERVALVGVRELDRGERALLREAGVHVYTMHDVDLRGLSGVVEEAIARTGAGTDGIHVSLDLDVVDPLQAPGVGTPVLGGLSYRETHLALEMVAQSQRMVSMDVVEVNPILDTHNETAQRAVQFTMSALGKRIM
jgi:arginase